MHGGEGGVVYPPCMPELACCPVKGPGKRCGMGGDARPLQPEGSWRIGVCVSGEVGARDWWSECAPLRGGGVMWLGLREGAQ